MSDILNLEELAAENQRLTNDSDGFLDQFVHIPDKGCTVPLRLLPPEKGGKLFQYNRVHSINGRKVHCPRTLRNGKFDRSVPCPICEYYQSLWKQADRLDREGRKDEADALKDEARQIKPVERYYYNAIVRRATDKDGEIKRNVGPKILSVGKTVHKKIIQSIVGDETGSGFGNITDTQRGRDFNICKELKGGFAEYGSSRCAMEPSPLGTAEEIERWRGNVHDLSKLRNPKSVEELEREIAIYKNIIQDDSEFDLEAIRQKFQPDTPDGICLPDGAVVRQEVGPVGGPADEPIPDDEYEAALGELRSNG